MNRSIPNTLSAHTQNPEQCVKFLAGNRSCFYRGFWNNAPYKSVPVKKSSVQAKGAKPGKN